MEMAEVSVYKGLQGFVFVSCFYTNLKYIYTDYQVNIIY